MLLQPKKIYVTVSVFPRVCQSSIGSACTTCRPELHFTSTCRPARSISVSGTTCDITSGSSHLNNIIVVSACPCHLPHQTGTEDVNSARCLHRFFLTWRLSRIWKACRAVLSPDWWRVRQGVTVFKSKYPKTGVSVSTRTCIIGYDPGNARNAKLFFFQMARSKMTKADIIHPDIQTADTVTFSIPSFKFFQWR